MSARLLDDKNLQLLRKFDKKSEMTQNVLLEEVCTVISCYLLVAITGHLILSLGSAFYSSRPTLSIANNRALTSMVAESGRSSVCGHIRDCAAQCH